MKHPELVIILPLKNTNLLFIKANILSCFCLSVLLFSVLNKAYQGYRKVS